MTPVTLPPLTAVAEDTPWGEIVVQPDADELMIYAAIVAHFAGQPIPAVPDSYSQASPFGTFTLQYKPETKAIVAAIAKGSAAQ